MTTYPARIAFALSEPGRTRVLDVAERLHLAVDRVDDGSFVVTVPDPLTAYRLGYEATPDGVGVVVCDHYRPDHKTASA